MQYINTDIIKFFDEFNGNKVMAHCISADWKMGAGVAAPIKKYFNIISFPYCIENIGKAIKTDSINGSIFNLITKDRYFHKPTYVTLEQTLFDMNNQLNGETLIIPKIGSGLDKLDWSKVEELINKNISRAADIIVCYI